MVDTNIDSMFKDMADAPAQGQTGNKIEVEGDFVVRVKTSKGQDGHFGKRLVIEYEVESSTVPDKVPVGSTKSWTAKWGDKQSLPDIKAFALSAAAEALEDYQPREREAIATFMAYAAVGNSIAGNASDVARAKLGDDGKAFEGDPFEGLRVSVSTKPKTTQAGFKFVQHRWAPAPPKAKA